MLIHPLDRNECRKFHLYSTSKLQGRLLGKTPYHTSTKPLRDLQTMYITAHSLRSTLVPLESVGMRYSSKTTLLLDRPSVLRSKVTIRVVVGTRHVLRRLEYVARSYINVFTWLEQTNSLPKWFSKNGVRNPMSTATGSHPVVCRTN